MKNLLRPYVRSYQWRGWFPMLLPHFCVLDDGLSTLGGPAEAKDPALLAALSLCDGSRTLDTIAGQARVARRRLIEAREAGLLVFWPRSVTPRPPEVPAAVELVVVSPHPDDAALSCGHELQAARGRSLIVNVFSQVAWWRLPIAPADRPRIQAARDAEEALVARLCGASLHPMGFPEATIRGCPLAAVFTAPLLPSHGAVGIEIAEAITALARQHPSATWRLPLGIGNHLDHRLARECALLGLRDAEHDPRRIQFYEDLPYAASTAERDEARFSPGPPLPGASDVGLTMELLRVYWSQLTPAQLRDVERWLRAHHPPRAWFLRGPADRM